MLTSYERTVRWRSNVKRKLIEACGGKCRLCGYLKCDKSLEFHHLDPSRKDFRISSKIRSVAKLAEEAKKCILLCANCHREVHAGVTACDDIEPIFNSEVFTKESVQSPCPQCGKQKQYSLKFCSRECAIIQRRRVDWNNTNLLEMLIRESFNISRVANRLGISHAAVRKKMRKLNISRP